MVHMLHSAAVAMLLLPAAASAGPIHWSAYGSSSTDAGASHVWVGNETKTTYDPATDLETQTEFILIADISGSYNWVGVGSDRFAALAVGPPQIDAHDKADGWANNRPPDFSLGLTLTDTMSGESAAMAFGASGRSDGFFQTGSFVMSLTVEDRTETVRLGDNLYTVRPVVRRSESADVIEFDVQATAAVNTPEPGTLALAGVGLAPLAVGSLRRARRRA